MLYKIGRLIYNAYEKKKQRQTNEAISIYIETGKKIPALRFADRNTVKTAEFEHRKLVRQRIDASTKFSAVFSCPKCTNVDIHPFELINGGRFRTSWVQRKCNECGTTWRQR